MRAAILLTALLVGGCVVSPGPLIVDQENSLSAAGFTVVPATTADRQAALARLPPNQVVQQFEGDRATYVYGDPIVCRCLYTGTQEAFARYQQGQIARRVAGAQLRAAQLNSDLAFDYGLGGYYGGFGFGFVR